MTNKNRLHSILLIASVLFFLILSSSVTSAGTETQLTQGERLVQGTTIYGNIVTWSETAGNGVHIYDLIAGKKIDVSGTTESNIPVYGNKIVWGDWDESVKMYDLSTGEEVQITPVDSGTGGPDIYGDNVVYTKHDYSNGSSLTGYYYRLYLYDLVTHKETQITTSDYGIRDPAIYGNKIVWLEYENNSKRDIYIYDIPTQRIGSISTSGTAEFDPDIYSNIVVWRETHNGKSDIYMRDIAAHTTTQITTSGTASDPSIYGNRIVWQSSYYVDDKWLSDIYMYDISTSKTTRITNSTRAFSPSIYGDKIVYADSRSHLDYIGSEVSDIYLYDLSSTAQNPPVAAFAANVTSGTTPLIVRFTDTSTDSPTSWLWDFGDGTISTVQNPTHAYTNEGGYTVILTVKNAIGSNTVSKYGYVLVRMDEGGIIAPAYFSSNVTSGIAPLTVLFHDTTFPDVNGDYAYGRVWDFGDMTNYGDDYNDNNSTYITHTYKKSGKYTVKLRSYDIGGGRIIAKYNYITVIDPNAPVADFNSKVTSGCAPLVVQFNDLSHKATSRIWDFNGDGQIDSSDINPVYVYANAGTYTVNLTVSNENGTTSKTALINVLTPSSSSGGSSGGSSHSSSSGGGGGGSPEPQSNVQVKELSQAFITNGKTVKFDFPKNETCVVYVSFDAKKTFSKITTIAEQLKGKSALVSKLPSGEVYKSFNVWVGNGGVATTKNIQNPVVCFKVEKSWIKDKKIVLDSITLNRCNDNKWEQFPVNLSGEDDKFLYFTAKTSGFSSFTATGTVKSSERTSTGTQIASPETTNNNTSSKEPQTKQKETPSTPCFEVYYGVASLFAVLLYKKR